MFIILLYWIYPAHCSKFKRYRLSSFGKFKEKKFVLNAVEEYFYTVLIVAVLKKNATSNYLLKNIMQLASWTLKKTTQIETYLLDNTMTKVSPSCRPADARVVSLDSCKFTWILRPFSAGFTKIQINLVLLYFHGVLANFIYENIYTFF